MLNTSGVEENGCGVCFFFETGSVLYVLSACFRKRCATTAEHCMLAARVEARDAADGCVRRL